jgi:RNA ligase (TIGR02306 family)
MKMAGLFSEGICFSCGILPGSELMEDGTDVTGALGVRKHDPELLDEADDALKKARAPKKWWQKGWVWRIVKLFRKAPTPHDFWLPWVSKTDETRHQNLNYIYEDYRGWEFSVTEKLDGQSVTFALDGKKFYVFSRNKCVANDGKNAWSRTGKKFHVEEKLRKFAKENRLEGVCIQGEQVGPGIQSNKLRFDDVKMFVFNMKVKGREYMPNRQVRDVCAALGLDVVPDLGTIKFEFKDATELQEFARGWSVFNSEVYREGIVLRPADRTMPAGKGQANMLSFKVINPDFLLRYGGG